MEIINRLWCNSCKVTDVPLIKTNKTIRKQKTFQYFKCRDCNNKRAKKYYAANKQKCRDIAARSRNKHKEKHKARVTLNNAIIWGKVIKPKQCSSCKKNKKIEGHHTDYSKALEVIWLCRQCHADVHKLDNK